MKATDTLRAHVDRYGQVWYQATDPEPKLFGNVADFVASNMSSDFTRVCAVGMRCNAELICQLYETRQRIDVCTPMIVEKRADRAKPGPVLFELGLCSWSPSQGGFHEVVDSDYRAYKVASHFTQGVGNAQMEELLLAHPAWRPLSFIRTISKRDLFNVLAHTIDPRWYIDVCYPDRGSKFYSWLGLYPHTQSGISTPSPGIERMSPGSYLTRICAYTMNCWKVGPEAAVRSILDLTGIKPISMSDRLGIAPWDFCWRAWATGKNPVQADLRGSRLFADFLRQTWLDAIYNNSAAVPDERATLFRPADFFKHEVEILAYEQHAAKA